MNQRPDPNQLLQEIRQTIQESMDILDKGGALNAGTLQDKAQYFCQVLAGLPAVEAKSYEPQLTEMIEHLSIISQKLYQNQATLRDEINALDYLHTARRAYTNAAALRRYAVKTEQD